MSSEFEGKSINRSDTDDAAPERDARTGQPVEEAEKNLSRHSTKDSSPSVEEQERTTLPGNDD
jgi:hypothetical protein